MPKSSRAKTRTNYAMQPTSQKLDAIDSWLRKMLDAFPQKGTITTEEIDDWQRDLTPFSVEAINFAFDTHRRNALFFPVYGQILDLCISHEPPEQRNTVTCDAACKAKHWTGYGWHDFLYLWKRMGGEQPLHFANKNPRLTPLLIQARALAGDKADSVVIARERASADVVKWRQLFDQLDALRSKGAPEWRRKEKTA